MIFWALSVELIVLKTKLLFEGHSQRPDSLIKMTSRRATYSDRDGECPFLVFRIFSAQGCLFRFHK